MCAINVPIRLSFNILNKWLPCVRHYTKHHVSKWDKIPTLVHLTVKTRSKCSYHSECFIRIWSLKFSACLFYTCRRKCIRVLLQQHTPHQTVKMGQHHDCVIRAVTGGPELHGMLCCHRIKTCNSFEVRRPTFSFCAGPYKVCSLF